MEERVQCDLCSFKILRDTHTRNEGLCGPCHLDLEHLVQAKGLGILDQEIRRLSRFLWLKRLIGIGWRKEFGSKEYRAMMIERVHRR